MDCLNCSSLMFKYLCSFHQIPPSFLDSIFSFGETLSPLDYGLAAFSNEDTLLARETHLTPVPSFGRSGREIRHSYLLRSVERSDSVPNWSWSIRQLAVYHSFDVVTGRSTWITVKGNGLMLDRVSEAVDANPTFQQNSPLKAHEAFAATLDIQLVMLDSCDENWRWYINSIYRNASYIVNKAKCVKIDSDPHFSNIPEDIKQNVARFNSFGAPKSASRTSTSASAVRSGLENIRYWMKKAGFGKAALASGKADPKGPLHRSSLSPGAANTDPRKWLDNLVILDMFSFKELQELQETAERIQEALLVVKLNSKVVAQIGAYYRSLMESEFIPLPEMIRKECRGDFLKFLARVESLQANMGIRAEQLESLLHLIRDGKTLVRSWSISSQC